MERVHQRPQSKFNLNSIPIRKFLINQERIGQTRVWPHQIEAAKSIYQHFDKPDKPRNALCVLPTGAGKSGIAVLSAYACNPSRVLIITPSETISNQLYSAFCNIHGESFLVSKGVTDNDYFRGNVYPSNRGVIRKTNQIQEAFLCDLVIANAHRFNNVDLENRGLDVDRDLDQLPKNIDLVIVDEAHHYPARTWRRIVDYFEEANKLFLTATPLHNGGPILRNQDQCLCYTLQKQTLIDRRIIRPVNFDDSVPPDYPPIPEFPNNPDGREHRKEYLHLRAFEVILESLSVRS
jgi:superfamily II DNA or RNA helicase